MCKRSVTTDGIKLGHGTVEGFENVVYVEE